MPRVLQLQNNTNITIESIAFGSGGSGDVFKIIAPSNYTHQVVKLYHSDRLNTITERKVKKILATPIQFADHESIIWIKDVVYENGVFVGFTMNYAEGVNLGNFLNDRWWRRNETKDWDKFKLENEKGLDNRIKLCLNIAKAVYILHQNKNISIVDIKPSNFIVNKNGLVSIIDIDNIEISENEKVIFPAQVITTDYSPPEFHKGLNYKTNVASQNWDKFSLAVVFYNILCGIHPFTGGCISPYETCSDYPDMIKNGLFPHGKKSKFFDLLNPLHSNFNKLNKNIQSLFIQCFDYGHESPHLRPSAEDWCKVFSNTYTAIVRPTLKELLGENSDEYLQLKKAFSLEAFSKPIQLKEEVSVSFPKVTFYDTSKIISPLHKLFSFLSKQTKQKTIDELKIVENRIKELLSHETFFNSDIDNVYKEFQAKQNKIIETEKEQITTLKELLKTSLDNANYSIAIQQKEEENEQQKLDNYIRQLVEKENIKLLQFHTETYGDIVHKYEVKKADYQSQLHKSETQKRQEIELHINSTTKLSNYIMAKECHNIFGSNLPSVLNALQEANFNNASDFTRVSSDGCLLNNSNKWIKIAGLGNERSNKLRAWRVNVELAENAKINASIKTKYDKLQNEILLQLNTIEREHQQKLLPLDQKFKPKELETINNKEKLIANREVDTDKIKSKYDFVHNDIKEKFVKTINTFYEELDNIYHTTKKFLQKNFDELETALQIKIDEANQFIFQIESAIEKYNQLYASLNVR